MPVEQPAPQRKRRRLHDRLPSRAFVAAVIALGGMQLMAPMDFTLTIVALPKIQNELGLSAVGRSWIMFASMLTCSGLILLGGRLGDIVGRKRMFIIGVSLFTVSSTMSGLAWDEATLVLARLMKGLSLAMVSPTAMALVATTFPKGPRRNTAAAVFGAMVGIGSVTGLVVGGILTDVSWRLAFFISAPIGLLVIYLARAELRETQKVRMKLDVPGALLATVTSTATVFCLSMEPGEGWLSASTIGSGAVALTAFTAFVIVERRAENPVVPFNLFFDRSRLATYASMFIAGGAMVTLVLLVAVYVQDIMGYSALRAGVSFIPFTIATATGLAVSSRLVMRVPPRVVVITGALLVLCGVLYGSTLNRGIPYFPNLVLPIVIGGIGIGMLNVPLGLSVIASVGVERIGPTTAIAVMLQGLGGPMVLASIQAIIMSHTLHLGGTTGPVKYMNAAQLNALDHGYAYGLRWLAGAVVLLILVALFIGYTARQVAHAQQAKNAEEPARAVDAERFDHAAVAGSPTN
ncbi:MFS transporter [Mycobacterium sp. 94-17]|nr:MFS transporter [Mycobacterium sp. 94-17]MEB4212039.1 MFS transporter [Mycobacterium sp. 94-17]